MKTFLTQGWNTVIKKSLVMALAIVMMVTLLPINSFAYSDHPSDTDRADAKLFPFPYDMSILSQYLYGSENNLTGKVKWNYFKNVPSEWYDRELPASLNNYVIGEADVNNRYRGSRSAAPGYFEPTDFPSKNYHSQRLKDLSKTKYSYLGPNNPSNENIAFYCAEGTNFKVLGYNDTWVAVWDCGGIDQGRGLSTTCGGIGREQYGSWKPAVYFLKRADVYIKDIRNKNKNVPQVTASATATCNTYIKTTPAKDKYVSSGMLKTNQLLQVTNPTPINGHYQVYYDNGLYYVNAKWVNLKLAGEQKAIITYTAEVNNKEAVDIKDQPNDSATTVAAAKAKFALDVVKKDAGNGYSEIWFNSKKCYIKTNELTNFKSVCTYETIKKLGKAKGTLILDAPWSAYGGEAYSYEAIKLLKKHKMDESSLGLKLQKINGIYPMSDGDSATVYSISKFVYKPDPRIPKYKEWAKIYKVVYDGKVCYVPIKNTAHDKYTYYKAGKSLLKAKSQSLYITAYATARAWKEAKVECYKIKGKHFFKLDDVAYLMSATNKSFKVTYDSKAIKVESMCPYSGTAPLKKGDGVKRKVIPSTLRVLWDGKDVGLLAYKINGKYYVSIEEIAYMTDSRIEKLDSGFWLQTTEPNLVEAYG